LANFSFAQSAKLRARADGLEAAGAVFNNNIQQGPLAVHNLIELPDIFIVCGVSCQGQTLSFEDVKSGTSVE
jgi:hypothetical protein